MNNQLTKNFNLSEFNCKDGTAVPNIYLDNVIELANNLQVLRDEIDSPVKIVSAYRHQEYNKKVGGAKNSQHLTAKAADIKTELTPHETYKTIERLIKDGKMKEGGLGLYQTFVHYDIRGVKARWIDDIS